VARRRARNRATRHNEQQTDHVLARELATRAAAFEGGVLEIHPHQIGIYAAAVTLAPQNTFVAAEALPLAGLRDTLGGLDGSRIRRELLDARY
jgi:hypothetical protein